MTDLLGRNNAQRLQPWQDARRIPPQYSVDAPAAFEWWYFDAQLSGGSAVIVAFVVVPGRVPPSGTDVILGGEDGFGWVNALSQICVSVAAFQECDDKISGQQGVRVTHRSGPP